jgi:hypothetical protein
MKQIWKDYKAGILLAIGLALFISGRAIYNHVWNLRHELHEQRQTLIQKEADFQLQKQAYIDSLNMIQLQLIKQLNESQRRLELLGNQIPQINEDFENDLRIIDTYTTVDERIQAFSSAIARQDSLWQRYLDRDDRRSRR